MTAIDTPEGIKFFQMLQFRGRLKLEIQGLKFKGPSTLQMYNRTYGTNFNRRKQALVHIEHLIEKAKEAKANEVQQMS